MVVRELKVKDFKGHEREYLLHFNMTEAEIMEFEFGRERGGISQFLTEIIRAQDTPAIMRELRALIMASYGVLTNDGESFQKSEEISRQFSYTTAYSDFMMNLYTDQAYNETFIKELVPPEVIKKILDRVEAQKKQNEEKNNAPTTDATVTVSEGPIVPGSNV